MIQLAARQPAWALGFVDETWWSRFAQPQLHAFAPSGKPLRLREHTPRRSERAPRALACYGVVWQGATPLRQQVWLRFVADRPLSGITTQFLAWSSVRLAATGHTAWLLVWDNAPWHVSRAVRQWVRQHNRAVKTGQIVGVRIVLCGLPSQSPWLNPIEAHWRHGKRRVLEAERPLSADELEARVLETFGGERLEHLAIPVNVT